jgi:hypothetical protein
VKFLPVFGTMTTGRYQARGIGRNEALFQSSFHTPFSAKNIVTIKTIENLEKIMI